MRKLLGILGGTLLLACRASLPVASEPWCLTPDAPFRAVAPELVSAPRTFRLPKVVRAALPSGLTVLVAPRRDFPEVAVFYVNRGGRVREPAGQPGVAELVARFLEEGTEMADGSTLRRLQVDGIDVRIGVTDSVSFVTQAALSARLPVALETVARVAFTPALDAVAFENAKARWLDDVVRRSRLWSTHLGESVRSSLYEAGHSIPPLNLSVESQRALTIADARAFYRSEFRPSESAVIVVGDVEASDAMTLVAEAFGPLALSKSSSGDSGENVEGTVVLRREPGNVDVYFRDPSAPALVFAALPAVSPKHPDYLPLKLAARFLDGQDASRIRSLRDERGASYSFGTEYRVRRGSAEVLLRSDVRGDFLEELLRQMLGQIEDLRARPVSVSTLRTLIARELGDLEERFGTNEDTAASLANLFGVGISEEELGELPERLRAVTPESLQRAVVRHWPVGSLKVALAASSPRGVPDELGEPRLFQLGPTD